MNNFTARQQQFLNQSIRKSQKNNTKLTFYQYKIHKQLLKKIAAAATSGYKYIYEFVLELTKQVEKQYKDYVSDKANGTPIPDAMKPWISAYEYSKKNFDYFGSLNKRNALKRKCNELIGNVSGYTDINILQEFIKNYWLPILDTIKKNKSLFEMLIKRNMVVQASSGDYTVEEINSALSNINGVSHFFISSNLLDQRDTELIVNYISPTQPAYSIYFVTIEDITNGSRVIKVVAAKSGKSKTALFNENIQLNSNDSIDVNQLKDSFKNAEAFIMKKIDPNYDGTNEFKNTDYTREFFAKNLSYFSDDPIGDNLSFEALATLHSWPAPTSNEANTESFEPVSISIEMNYSYINELNKLINLLSDKKIKFTFTRKANIQKSLIKPVKNFKRLIRNAVTNINIQDAFKAFCSANSANIVATYYYKKIPMFDAQGNEYIDPEQCCGVILDYANKFIAIPASSFALLSTANFEYSQLSERQQKKPFYKKFWHALTNPIEYTKQHAKDNNTIEEFVTFQKDSPEIRYKYVMTNIKGIKEFTDFNQANKYMKDYSFAQGCKVEDAYSQYKSSDTQIQEHILVLTFTLQHHDSIFHAVNTFVNRNQTHINNVNEVKQLLAKVPN